jgi:hypothetical protein
MHEIFLDETLTPNLNIKLTSFDVEGGMLNQHYRPLPSSVLYMHYYGPPDDHTWMIKCLKTLQI